MNSKQYEITLKQGDACRIDGLTEENYHKVCKRFIESGAGSTHYLLGYKANKHYAYIEWYNDNLCHTSKLETNATVYTYEQIMEEEDMNTFNKKDLKTGMRITKLGGASSLVFTDVRVGKYVYPIIFVSCTESYWDHRPSLLDITRVEVCSTPAGFSQIAGEEGWHDHHKKWTVIWEREPELTPEQIKQQELQARYDAAKKELEELGKALGTVK